MPEASQNIAEIRVDLPVSACPGLFRIVPARDGGICRVKLPLGQVSADQARAVADASARFGNGIIEATNRANLQIRGIAAAGEAALTAALLDAGLGPTRAAADDIRNVMVNPTAAIDPLQRLDSLPLARELLDHLQSDTAYGAISAKFCLLVDGGEGVAVVDHPHDIWLASMGKDAGMALGFAGTPPTQEDDVTPFLAIQPQHAVAAVTAALSLFLDEAAKDPDIRRFRQLFVRMPREKFLDRLADKIGIRLHRGANIASWRRPMPVVRGHVGVRQQHQPGLVFIGAVPPVGRLSPPVLGRLAAIAEEFGDGSLRFTPWQSVIVPSVPSEIAAAAKRALEAIGLVCDSAHPLVSIVACAGNAGCASAMSDTKADALAIAQALGTDDLHGLLHLSGCTKSCASTRVADVTLIASAPGTYELFRKAGGGGKFGQSVARDVDVRQAGARIRELMTEERG